jgi:hypothetical protein
MRSHVHLSAELHCAKCQLAHDEAGVSESAVLHFFILLAGQSTGENAAAIQIFARQYRKNNPTILLATGSR